MVRVVNSAADWDEAHFSLKRTPTALGVCSGHQGEWLSVAVGAFVSAGRADLITEAQELSDRMHSILDQQERLFLNTLFEFKSDPQPHTMQTLLAVSTLVAHNCGDFDRMIEHFGEALPSLVSLRGRVGQATEAGKGQCRLAGDLNKRFMAHENHRHMGLRQVRFLRTSRHFITPIGPFWEGWGEGIVKQLRSGVVRADQVGELVRVLWESWGALVPLTGHKTSTYPRALHGILEAFPGGLRALEKDLPSRISKALKTGDFWSLSQESQPRHRARMVAQLIKAIARR
jgi:hypothetical protein